MDSMLKYVEKRAKQLKTTESKKQDQLPKNELGVAPKISDYDKYE